MLFLNSFFFFLKPNRLFERVSKTEQKEQNSQIERSNRENVHQMSVPGHNRSGRRICRVPQNGQFVVIF